jgi:hypothetical protein
LKGIVRPCRAHLGPELHARWQAHLCGLCVTLRDVAAQAERVLTGYDVLLLSVLVEAQAGQVGTSTAGPCPLRGLRPATVVASSTGAARLAEAWGSTRRPCSTRLPGPQRPSGRWRRSSRTCSCRPGLPSRRCSRRPR